MEIKVEAPKTLEEGLHEGVIKLIEFRTEPFKYTDLVIECDRILLKAGYPTSITVETELGKLLTRFGVKLEEGKSIDLDKELVGRYCKFLSKKEVTARGTFSNIIPDSVKPR